MPCDKQLTLPLICSRSSGGLGPVQTPIFSWAELKYMKSSASESIKNGYFNLERLSRSFRLAWPGISPLERLWNCFDSDAELFMSRSWCINYYNVFYKTADISSCFGSKWIKFGVWINRRTFVNLGRSKFELSSAHEKIGVWTGP